MSANLPVGRRSSSRAHLLYSLFAIKQPDSVASPVAARGREFPLISLYERTVVPPPDTPPESILSDGLETRSRRSEHWRQRATWQGRASGRNQ